MSDLTSRSGTPFGIACTVTSLAPIKKASKLVSTSGKFACLSTFDFPFFLVIEKTENSDTETIDEISWMAKINDFISKYEEIKCEDVPVGCDVVGEDNILDESFYE